VSSVSVPWDVLANSQVYRTTARIFQVTERPGHGPRDECLDQSRGNSSELWALTVDTQIGRNSYFGRVRTFYTTSSRADTARTRRRLLRPALAPAPLRERAGRLARDTVTRMIDVVVVASGTARRALCGAAPPASSPLRVPIRPALCASLVGDCPLNDWGTCGAGRIGSKRLDPGSPATPRPAIAGRPGACRR